MSRLIPIEKACAECGKKFFAKRSDAIYCGNLCRAVVSNREKIENAVNSTKSEIIKQIVHVAETTKNPSVSDIVEAVKSVNPEGHCCIECGKTRDNDLWATCNTCHSVPVSVSQRDIEKYNRIAGAQYIQKRGY